MRTTRLIARRIRDPGVYSEILPGKTDLASISQTDQSFSRQDIKIRGIILSGSPFSAIDSSNPVLYPSMFRLGLPVPGVNGFHQLTLENGGAIKSHLPLSTPRLHTGVCSFIQNPATASMGRRFLKTSFV